MEPTAKAMIIGDGGAVSEDKEQILQEYVTNKQLLLECLRKGTPLLGKKSNEMGKVGLVNHGATCYLNSFLQVLFNDEEFRAAIYQVPSSLAREGSVVKELQRLFVQLQYSDCVAVNTSPLMTAFGWSRANAFEQHDIVELFDVLIDALSGVSSQLKSDVMRLFEGTSMSVLTCPECGFRSEKSDPYRRLGLDVLDTFAEQPSEVKSSIAEEGGVDAAATADSSAPATTVPPVTPVAPPQPLDVNDLLLKLSLPETLEEDYKWQCGRCEKKVRAEKKEEFTSAPDRLVLQLKRFCYDPFTRRRRKLTTFVKFPNDLEFCGQSYALRSTLVHTGTGMGGHYRAFIVAGDDDAANLGGKEGVQSKTSKWIHYNDANVEELDENEERTLFWMQPHLIEQQQQQHDEELASSHLTQRNLLYENAYLFVYEKKMPFAVLVAAVGVSSGGGREEGSAAPTELVEEVKMANAELALLKRLLHTHTLVVTCQIYYRQPAGSAANSPTNKHSASVGDSASPGGGNGSPNPSPRSHVYAQISLFVYLTDSLEKVTSMAHLKAVENGWIDAAAYPCANCRLRLYEYASDRPGETFGSREECSLENLVSPQRLGGGLGKDKDIGGGNAISFLLEHRTEDDKPFVEFNPREMALTCVLFQREEEEMETEEQNEKEKEPVSSFVNLSIDIAPPNKFENKFTVTVPGEDKATVGELRQMLALLLDVSSDNIALIISMDRGARALLEDDRSLAAEGLYPADEVIVEIIDDTQAPPPPPQEEEPEEQDQDYFAFTLGLGGVMGEQEQEQPVSASANPKQDDEEEVTRHKANAARSFALAANSRRCSQITVCYNDPAFDLIVANASKTVDESDWTSSSRAPAASLSQYTRQIKVLLGETIGELKASVAKELQLEPSSFFVRKDGSKLPQLKDMNKTLKDLCFGNLSILHVEMGEGCQDDEHMLTIEFDLSEMARGSARDEEPEGTAADGGGEEEAVAAETAETAKGGEKASATFVSHRPQKIKIKPTSSFSAGSLIVSEKITVLALKRLILEKWSTLVAVVYSNAASSSSLVGLDQPASVHHLRLTDERKKTQIMRDDKILVRTLLGLADGRKVIVSILPFQEKILAEDAVLNVRVYQGKSFSRSCPLAVPRSCTIKMLRVMVAETFFDVSSTRSLLSSLSPLSSRMPEQNEGPESTEKGDDIDLVAAPSTTMPLTLKIFKSLKWLSALLKEKPSEGTSLCEGPISAKPLNLRDGSILLVRSISRAEEEAARAAAASLLSEMEATPRGGGREAVVMKKKLATGNKPWKSNATSNSRTALPKRVEKSISINIRGYEGSETETALSIPVLVEEVEGGLDEVEKEEVLVLPLPPHSQQEKPPISPAKEDGNRE